MDSGLSSEIYESAKSLNIEKYIRILKKIGGSVDDSHARKLEKINISSELPIRSQQMG